MPHMLKNALSKVLLPEEVSAVYSAFDMIGDIVIIKVPDKLVDKKELIGNAVLSNVPNARGVFMQSSPVRGEFRVRDLEHIAGANSTLTEYRENGCRFKVDVARTYFSPRLSTERERISRQVGENELIINMFAGVGTFSIIIAKRNKTCLVYSIDSNDAAIELSKSNAALNKVDDRVISINDEADRSIRNSFRGIADRVLMPLPERAADFVESAIIALKPNKTGIIHYFLHVKSDDKLSSKEDARTRVNEAFSQYDHRISELRVVREVGPRIYQLVADVEVDKKL